jgi:hypothetical protein
LDCENGKHGYQQSPLLLYESHCFWGKGGTIKPSPHYQNETGYILTTGGFHGISRKE